MKILIADDDRIVRKLLAKILSSEPGYEIREAADGEDCWAVLESGYAPDVCLLDIEMPRLTGLDLLERMRRDERFRDIPVLMVTSKSDINSKASAAALSAFAFVVKPFNPKTVLGLTKDAAGSVGRVFQPYGFEDGAAVMARESMDAAGYFRAMTFFVEMLALRLEALEAHAQRGRYDVLGRVVQPLRQGAERVGATVFLEYFGKFEALAGLEESEAARRAPRHLRMLKAEYQELKSSLEAYLQVVIASDSKRRIATQPDMTDWSGEGIRLSAEIEETFFDERGGFSLGRESIILRGFRGDQSVALARMEVKDGRVVISSVFDAPEQGVVDLGRFARASGAG